MTSKITASPTRQSFDVIVLGSQIAGAVAGALLARRGYRVLAVEHNPLPADYVEGDFRLPFGPTVLPGLRGIPSAQRVFSELGIQADIGRAAQPVGALQILAERARVDLFAQPERRAAEIGREFGRGLGSSADAMTAAIEALLLREEANSAFFAGDAPLPAEGLWQRWQLQRAARGLALGDARPLVTPVDHPLARGLKELWRLSNYLVEQESLPEPNVVDQPARVALRPLAHWLRGAAHVPGGEAGLAALLRRRLESAGGAVLGGETAIVEEIAVERGRITALKLLDSGREYRAQAFVVALDSGALRDLVPASGRQGRGTQALEAVRTRSELLVLNLVVGAKGLPPGLGEAAIGLPPAPGRSFFLQVSPVVRLSGTAAGDEKLLTLSMQVPPASLASSGEGLRKLALELRRGAESFLPFLDRHVRFESFPQPQRGLHPRLEIGRRRQLGVSGLAPRSVFKNVVLASNEVLPGLGLEGDFITGLRAAALVQQAVPKADPLHKR